MKWMKWDEDEWRVYSRFEVKDVLRCFKYSVGILHAVVAEGITASFASYLFWVFQSWVESC